MSHTNSTAHYGLPQFVSTDKPTYLGDSNSAYLAIDNGINSAQVKADTAEAKTTENAGKITDLQSALTQTNQQVSTVQQIANNANGTAISAKDLANAMAEDGAIGTANLANKAVTSDKIDFTTFLYPLSFRENTAKILTTSWQNCFETQEIPQGHYMVLAICGANVTNYYDDLGDVQFSIDGGTTVHSYSAKTAWIEQPIVFMQEVDLSTQGKISIHIKRSYINGGTIQSMPNNTQLIIVRTA